MFDKGLPSRFERLLCRLSPAIRTPSPNYGVAQDRPFVRAGKIGKRAGVRINVFHRQPDATHEAFGDGREMDGVAVQMLGGSNWEIQGLEGKGLATVNLAKEPQDRSIAGNRPNVFAVNPSVLKTLAGALG